MGAKVAVYFRCSTDKQDKSIGDQRRAVETYVQANGLEVVAWFDQDDGKSGTSFEKRPDFMRMVRAVESGQHPFSQILVYDVDRWGRPIDPNESVYWEYHFKRQGVQVVYILDESVNANSLAGRLNKHIKQELASEESHKQSLRVRERSKARAAEGFRVGGFAPYGYKRLLVEPDGTPVRVLQHGERKYEKHQRVRLTPGDEGEIKTVRRIFELCASGKGPRYIANLLNREGIPAPGAKRPYHRNLPGKWSIGTVFSILANSTYIGHYTYNRQIKGSWAKQGESTATVRTKDRWVVAKSAHEGIVPLELFLRVQKGESGWTRTGGRGRGSANSDYLLSGLVVCSQCGYNLHGHRHYNGYGKTYRYYEDSGHNLHGNSVCRQLVVPAETLEGFILRSLDEAAPEMTDPVRLKSLIRQKLADRQNGGTGDRQQIESRLQEIGVKLENLTKAVEAGGQFESILTRMADLRNEQERLRTELRSAKKREVSSDDLEAAVSEILKLSTKAFALLSGDRPQTVKEGLRHFVDRVEVNPREKTATYFVRRIPALPAKFDDFVSVNSCRRSGQVDYRHDDYYIFIQKFGEVA